MQKAAMFRFLSRKQQKVQELVLKYLEALELTQRHFSMALERYFSDSKALEDFRFLTDETHRFESQADDVRDKIKTLMYEKVLLPESREDIMRLLDNMDNIPRYMEIVLNMIKTQKLAIPDFLIPDIRELVNSSLHAVDLMRCQVEDLFRRKGRIKELMSVIDQAESVCDRIERRLVAAIFDSDLDGFSKLQLKELVLYLGEISDQVDRMSKQINIVNLKRHI